MRLKAYIGLFFLTILCSPAARADEVQIVALGDSLTQGFGLFAEDGLTAQLERWLTDQGATAKVINAGVSGDTTAGGLSRIEWSLSAGSDALIVTLGGNDVLRGLPPEAARANLDGILQVAQARDLPVLLIGIEAPGNYGADYKTAFDAIYPELSAAYGTLYVPNILSALTVSDLPFEEVMQADGLHPNAKGVALIVDEIGPKVLELYGRANANP